MVRSILCVGLAILALSSSAGAQFGTVSGTVRSQDNGRPLAYANIIVAGTHLGAICRADGKFVIENVPTGTRTIRAIVMGYEASSQTVYVSRLAANHVEFRLAVTDSVKRESVPFPAGRPLAKALRVRAPVDSGSLAEMPVADVLERVARAAGIVREGDEMRIT